MPGPPRIDPARGDRASEPHHTFCLVPCERIQGTGGAMSSAGGPVILTPRPGASLPPDLESDPSVAHNPKSSYTGHVSHVFQPQDNDDHGKSRQNS